VFPARFIREVGEFLPEEGALGTVLEFYGGKILSSQEKSMKKTDIDRTILVEKERKPLLYSPEERRTFPCLYKKKENRRSRKSKKKKEATS